MTVTPSVERQRVGGFGRLDLGLHQDSDWYLWGPYLSERQWGTVREDCRPDGDAWNYLPHDHARSRAYRWGEDGLAGFCDIEQRLCVAVAFWNGRDPILKERSFGLTGARPIMASTSRSTGGISMLCPATSGTAGATTTRSGLTHINNCSMRTGGAASWIPSTSCSTDTRIFDEDRYWVVDVNYTKADPTDILMTISVTNAGPDTELLHVLPTMWYRSTWSWDADGTRPAMAAASTGIVSANHPFFGQLELLPGLDPQGAFPELLFCDNDTNRKRLYGVPSSSRWPKDGINDHVVSGADTVNPERRGVFHSVPNLIASIEKYLDAHNEDPAPTCGPRQPNQSSPKSHAAASPSKKSAHH
jgi:hypothetical protein